MRRLAAFLLVSAAAVLAASPAIAQGPLFVDVHLDPTVITVGDRVRAVLTLVQDNPSAPAPMWPEWGEQWGGSTVLETGPVQRVDSPSAETGGARTIYRQEIVLTAFRPGEVVLPPERIALGETFVNTATAVFMVRSVLAEGENAPRPPSPPMALAPGAAFAWLAAILLFAAVYLASRLDFSRAVAAVAAERPPLSPIDQLERCLRSLDPSRCEPAHTGISRGLRTYLAGRLEIPLLESTTRELAERLRGVLPDASVARLVTLAMDCDRVKYARREEPPAITAERVDHALEIGREIDALLRPRVEEQAGQAGRETGESVHG